MGDSSCDEAERSVIFYSHHVAFPVPMFSLLSAAALASRRIRQNNSIHISLDAQHIFSLTPAKTAKKTFYIMKLPAKLLLSVSGAVLVFTARATAVSFTDTTFNLANYSESIGTTSGATVSFAQCPSCGHPGQALQILVTFATTADAAGVGFVNNSFAYNPSVVPIASINASVDKNVSSNIPFNPSTTIPTAFWPLIEQDGLFYLAPVSGPTYHGGTTGYLHHSQSGLVATDFTQFNFTTGTFGTAHPDFAGDLMLFGLAQLTGAAINNENAEIDYDNLKLSITAVPEAGSTGVLLLCSLAALLLVSRMCQCHQAS
jgi:hypothetical protein